MQVERISSGKIKLSSAPILLRDFCVVYTNAESEIIKYPFRRGTKMPLLAGRLGLTQT